MATTRFAAIPRAGLFDESHDDLRAGVRGFVARALAPAKSDEPEIFEIRSSTVGTPSASTDCTFQAARALTDAETCSDCPSPETVPCIVTLMR